MTKDRALKVRVSDAEFELIEQERQNMQKFFLGVKVTMSDALRHLIQSDRRHEARLWDLNSAQIQIDLAAHLHMVEGDKFDIVHVLNAFEAAHQKARQERNRRLGIDKMEVTDISRGGNDVREDSANVNRP